MSDQDEQGSGDVVQDSSGYLAISLFAVIVILIGLFALALVVSA